MAGERAYSSSKNQSPDQLDDVWSTLQIPQGKEFDLPNLYPFSSDLSDGNRGLTASSFGSFDSPIGSNEASLQAITGPSRGGNLMDSFQVWERAPSVRSTLLMGDKQKDNSLRAQEIRPTNVPFSAGASMSGYGILQPAQNQPMDIHVVPSIWLPGSNDSTISNNQAYFSSSRNEGTHFPVTNGLSSIPGQRHNSVSPLGLQNSALTMDTPVFVPTPRVTQTIPSLVDFPGPAQAFSDCPFQACNGSSCNVRGCGRIVKYPGNYGTRVSNAFGGNENPIPTYVNSTIIAANALPVERNTQGNKYSIEAKGKGKMPAAGVRFPHGGIQGNEWGQHCKRIKLGPSEHEIEYPPFTGPMRETNSPGLVCNMISELLDSNDLAHAGQLVFKEPSNSKS